MFALFKLVSLKDWLYIGAFLFSIGAYSWFVHHERVIGEERCVAAQVRVQAEAQAAIEANAKATNDKLQAAYNASIYSPIDYRPAIDCGSVPADVLMRINATGKTRKH